MELHFYPNNHGTDLCRIAAPYTTDKCYTRGWHSYTELYHHFLSNRRASCKAMLEIGVGNTSCMGSHYRIGDSLLMWRDYFPNATVYSIDLDPATMIRGEQRIETFVCDQTDGAQLGELFSNVELDLILDDGSHHPGDQLASLRLLWPRLAKNGFYIIEDVVNECIEEVMSGVQEFVRELPADQRPRYQLIRIHSNLYKNEIDDNLLVLTL